MFKKLKLIGLASAFKIIKRFVLIYLGLKQESSYVGKQKIVFYKTKVFKPPPYPTIVLIHGFGADKNHWLAGFPLNPKLIGFTDSIGFTK